MRYFGVYLVVMLVWIIPGPTRVFAAKSLKSAITFDYEVFAIANGPCVVCFTLMNTTDTDISLNAWSDEVFLLEPKSKKWTRKSVFEAEHGSIHPGQRFYQLKPKERLREFVDIHYYFQPSDVAADFEMKVKFREHPKEHTRSRSDVTFDFSKTITIKPDAYSKAVAAKLAKRIVSFSADLSDEDRLKFYSLCVLHTSIPDFLSLALEVVNNDSVNMSKRIIFWIIENIQEDIFWPTFFDHGISGNSIYGSLWIEELHGHPQIRPFDRKYFHQFRSVASLPARLAAAYYFSEIYSKSEYQKLIEETSKWLAPISVKDLGNDVLKLSDKSFRTREFASARLCSLGERSVSPLTEILKTATDPEVRSRLESIIKHNRKAKISPGDAHLISIMRQENPRRSIRIDILTALAKNDPESNVTQAAARALSLIAD